MVVSAGELGAYARFDMAYDNNLFRLSDEAKSAFGQPKTSDTYYTTTLGMAADTSWSRQHLAADVHVKDTRFKYFEYLNNDGGSANIGWDYQIYRFTAGAG